jgi:hypothetical protein
MRLNSAALFALAVSIAVPFAPARALFPAAPTWARSAEINQLVIKIKLETEADRKARRQARKRTAAANPRWSVNSPNVPPPPPCTRFTAHDTCARELGCKWQKGTLVLKGYCYASAPGVAKPRLGHKPR